MKDRIVAIALTLSLCLSVASTFWACSCEERVERRSRRVLDQLIEEQHELDVGKLKLQNNKIEMQKGQISDLQIRCDRMEDHLTGKKLLHQFIP